MKCGSALAVEPNPEPYTPDHLEREVFVVRESMAGGERKEVTVLIADVAGSLAMAEALDPEDIHALMDGFFALALEAVHAEGGTVNQFRGDGFMALFGAPRARGDDAARALRAALEVRNQARLYAESVRARYGLPFAIRIGISTGLVWVGAIGNALRRDYTAEGPTVGLAARLEDAAAPGQILVGEATVRRARGRFESADLGARTFRGLAEPVRVFELIGDPGEDPRGASGHEGAGTPFVGRLDELRDLRRAIAIGDRLRCVEIRGEAGIGKTRLAREVARTLPPDVAVLELAGHESGVQRAYRAWLGLLRDWPGVHGGAAEADELLDALEGRGGAAPGPDDVARVVHDLFALLLAARPVLLLVDNAQWLDPSSRVLLARLCADPPEGSLAVLATLRSEEAADWVGASVTSIRLGPLSAQDARALALGIVGDLPHAADLAELAWLRGGGNPLFVEEVARALSEGVEALRDAARAEVSLSRVRERVPETLHAVVAARIDALPEGAKRLLEAAAVVGEPFAAEMLSEVEPGASADGEMLIAELVERGLLVGSGPGDLDFRHGVVRSGAYDQLVRERRSSLHRGVAEALAKRPVGESPDGAARIGHHFDRAGDADSAARHLLRAGDGYTALRAFRESVAQLGRAYELVRGAERSDPQLETAIGLNLASVLGAQDRSGEAAAVLESLDLERAGSGDQLRLAFASVQTGWVRFSNDNDVARGRRLVEQGLRMAEGLANASDVALLGEGYLARIELLDGELAQSLAAARRMTEAAVARGDLTSLAMARYHENAVHFDAGRAAEARRVADEALFETRASDSDLVRAIVSATVARAHLATGDVEGCLEAARLACAAADKSGQVGLRYNATAIRGYALLLRGSMREAHRTFESLAALNDRWPTTALHSARGWLEIGDLESAAQAAGRCLASAPPRAVRARALALRGLAIGLGAGRRDAGEALLGEALDSCHALGLDPFRAEVHGFLAELSEKRGDAALAAHHARSAADTFEHCGMPAHAARFRAAR
jgi:class 3 adenylate cyclase/tetratricopeptide (TPR) repeat protein